MNEVKFKNLEDIKNFKIKFKYFSIPIDDCYYATFHIYNKENETIYYQVDFVLNDTEYNTDIIRSHINEKYDNLENCFYQAATKYLKERISQNNLKNETISIKNILI